MSEDKLDARRARARREIERMDGGAHLDGRLGGYDNFYQNFRCALDALRCGITETPEPPKNDIDVLAHALVMFEDMLLRPMRKPAALTSEERAILGAVTEVGVTLLDPEWQQTWATIIQRVKDSETIR